MNTRTPEDYIIESGPMGAIGEAGSLILRVNRNCPWNRCLFCSVYKDKKFGRRSAKDIKKDIDAVGRICHLVEATSFEMGFAGNVSQEIVLRVIRKNMDIFENEEAISSLYKVANWQFNGSRRVFLQDANALAMNPGEMSDMLRYLKERFPTIETVTCYARSKTGSRRTREELRELKEAGLSWCFIGVESGCDDVLGFMKKGVTRAEHLDGGGKLMDAGIHIAAFIMPGLAGGDRVKSEKHVTETIALLNDMRPTEVRVRSIAILEASLLYKLHREGKFVPAKEDQMIEEIYQLIRGLHFDCTFETYQMTNVLFNSKENLTEMREDLMSRIEAYKRLMPIEQARLRFNRYLHGGYVDFLRRIGRADGSLNQLIDEAAKDLENGSADAAAKAEQAIFAIKSTGVP